MAIVVGGVAIDLEASAAQYVAEMDKAARATLAATQKMQSDLSRWRTGFRGVETGILGATGRITRSLVGLAKGFAVGLGGGALAGALSGGGLALLAKQATDTAGALVDAADKAGLTTDTYQELVFQAQQAGASQDTLNTALQAFGVRMGEARSGTGSLVTTMQQLNPELATAVRNATSQEDALRIVADAMKNAGSQADALAISQAAFSRGGRDMTLVFRDGAAGMDAFAAKAREFGLVLDEDLLRKAEEAGDQLDLLAAVIKSQLTGAIIEAAPAISQLAVALARLIPQIVDAAREWAAWLGVISQTRTEALASSIADIDRRLQDFRQTLADIKATGNLEGVWFENPEQVDAEIAHLEGRIKDLSAAREDLQAQMAGAVAVLPPPVVRPPPKFEGEPVDFGEIAREAERVANERKAIADRLTGERLTALGSKIEQEEFRRKATPGLGAGGTMIAGMGLVPTRQQIAELPEAKQLGEDLRFAAEWYDEINAGAATFAQIAASGFTDAITQAKSLNDALIGVIDALGRAVLEALILQAVTAAVGQAGGGGALGALFPAPAPKAAGGPVAAGMPYWVGERGQRELFVPSSAGTIIPNSELRNGGGGGGNVIHIDARQSTPGTAAAAVNAALRMAPGAVVNAQSRGQMGRGKHPF